MKKHSVFLIAGAMSLLLTACVNRQTSAELQSNETTKNTESEIVTQGTETISSETTLLTTAEATETAAEANTEITSETSSQSETSAETTTIITTAAVTVTSETTSVTAQKPKQSKFVDFEFTELKGTANIGKLADKAVEFIKTTDEYILSMADIFELKGGEYDDYISNEKIIPRITGAYPDDYDGDGKTETFIMLELPRVDAYSYEYTHKYFVFADSSGNMTLLDNTPQSAPVCLLNYGKVKQVIFSAYSPSAAAEEHYSIYGVKNGQAELLCTSQMDYRKNKCFLLAPNKWGQSIMMYYDLEQGKYVNVSNREIPVSEIQEMDKAGNIEYNYEKCFLVGNKFYVMYDPHFVCGTYTYENGEFVDAGFWLYTNWDNSDSEEIDYDKAVSSMTGLLY